MAVLLLVAGFLAVLLSPAVTVELVSGRSVLAYQTGVWSGMTADKAVDGLKDRTHRAVEYYKSVCAHPDTGNRNTPARWSVDLGGTYRIFTITVWNTQSGGYHRMRNFVVGVNQTGQDDVICGSHGDTPVPAGGSETFTCPGIVTGSGVFLRKLLEAPEPHLITICEVNVNGEVLATTPPVSYEYTNEYVGVDSENSTTLTIIWEQIPVSSDPSQDYGYLVVYWPGGDKTRDEFVPYDSTVTRQSLTLSGLTPNTRYLVEIRPYRLQDDVRVYGTSYPQQSANTHCGVVLCDWM